MAKGELRAVPSGDGTIRMLGADEAPPSGNVTPGEAVATVGTDAHGNVHVRVRGVAYMGNQLVSEARVIQDDVRIEKIEKLLDEIRGDYGPALVEMAVRSAHATATQVDVGGEE